MHIIKLGAITSTNDYLKHLEQKKELDDFTVVVCEHQTNGRGQKGNSWVSENGKNLTVSVLKRFSELKAVWGFTLNCAISLAISEVLQELSIPEIKVKWPNDIMSGNQKLCGILAENTLQGERIKHSIIGFGLNVNQVDFGMLAHTTSLKGVTGMDYDLEELLHGILEKIKIKLEHIKSKNFESLKRAYESMLFKKDVPSKFSRPDGTNFVGTIQGINTFGKLVVKLENGTLSDFGLQEVRLHY